MNNSNVSRRFLPSLILYAVVSALTAPAAQAGVEAPNYHYLVVKDSSAEETRQWMHELGIETILSSRRGRWFTKDWVLLVRATSDALRTFLEQVGDGVLEEERVLDLRIRLQWRALYYRHGDGAGSFYRDRAARIGVGGRNPRELPALIQLLKDLKKYPIGVMARYQEDPFDQVASWAWQVSLPHEEEPFYADSRTVTLAPHTRPLTRDPEY